MDYFKLQKLNFKNKKFITMIIRNHFSRLLLFSLLIFHAVLLQDTCQSKETLTMIDISTSKIMRTSIYEYKVENYDNSANFTKNDKGELVFIGNFSKLTLVNKAIHKQYTYAGNQIIFRVPSTHFYSKNKSAEAQLQIVYELVGQNDENRYKMITMTQMYLVTKFRSRVGVNVCQEINKYHNGTIFRTSKLIKIMQNMPVLMYQGSKNFYPCRSDILCMIRKEFTQISEQDALCLREQMKIQTFKSAKKARYSQKSLFQVAQVSQNNDL